MDTLRQTLVSPEGGSRETDDPLSHVRGDPAGGLSAPTKPLKILFVLHVSSQARHFTSLYDTLLKRGHKITLLVEKRSHGPLKKPGHLEHLEGLEVKPLVYPKGVWGKYARAFRGARNYLLYYHPETYRGTIFRERAYSWIDPHLRQRIPIDKAPSPDFVEWLQSFERAVPPAPALLDLYREEKPDVVLVSPLIFYQHTFQPDYVKAAHALGIPVGFPVFSWDNLTTKGILQAIPDRIWVWNDIQRQELERYHGAAPESIGVMGAWRFDEFRNLSPSCDRETYCRNHGLDPARPIIAYLGSSPAIAPEEGDFVARWLSAVRSSDDPVLAEANVLVRAHPRNINAWKAAESIRSHERVHLQEPAQTSFWDAQNLYDLLHHCHVAVGLNTSAMLEAAVLLRPVHTVRDPQVAQSSDGTLHFDYLAKAGGGLLYIAEDMDSHVRMLSEPLTRPAHFPDARAQSFFNAFIDGAISAKTPTERLTEEVEALARLKKTPRKSSVADKAHTFGWWLQLKLGLIRVQEDEDYRILVQPPMAIGPLAEGLFRRCGRAVRKLDPSGLVESHLLVIAARRLGVKRGGVEHLGGAPLHLRVVGKAGRAGLKVGHLLLRATGVEPKFRQRFAKSVATVRPELRSLATPPVKVSEQNSKREKRMSERERKAAASQAAPASDALQAKSFAAMRNAAIEQMLLQYKLKFVGRDDAPLATFGERCFSQNGEDGIIAEIFRRLGAPCRTFVEVGAGDGTENNTIALLLAGARGAWFEIDEANSAAIRTHQKSFISTGQLKFERSRVTAENIEELLTRLEVGAELDLLSIDVDGNDYWIWKAITSVNPKVVVIEYNAAYGSSLSWVMKYNANHNWAGGNNYFGASLKALERLGAEKGYALVGCDFMGVNAFFVRTDLLGQAFPGVHRAEAQYHPFRRGLGEMIRGKAPLFGAYESP